MSGCLGVINLRNTRDTSSATSYYKNSMKRWHVGTVALLAGLSLGVFLSGPILHGQVTQSVPLPKELTSFRNVVKSVLPAVVSIESRTKVTRRGSCALPLNIRLRPGRRRKQKCPQSHQKHAG